jgi:hypothetical protein
LAGRDAAGPNLREIVLLIRKASRPSWRAPLTDFVCCSFQSAARRRISLARDVLGLVKLIALERQQRSAVRLALY